MHLSKLVVWSDLICHTWYCRSLRDRFCQPSHDWYQEKETTVIHVTEYTKNYKDITNEQQVSKVILA